MLPGGAIAAIVLACGPHRGGLLPEPDAASSLMLAMRVLRFPAAIGRDPAVDEWLDRQPTEFRPLARSWFEQMRACGGDVRELIHDGAPTACVQDAAFGYVAVFRAHMNVGLFNGAILPDPAGLLEGNGKFMRHVKVRPGAEPDPAALSSLIVAAYRDMKARLRTSS